MTKGIIEKINEVADIYFESNSKTDWIPAKSLMPELIKKGVFTKDIKKGLPLRRVLRDLDKANALTEISLVHAQRNENNVYWYFVREGAKFTPKEPLKTITKKQKAKNRKQNSDEYYIIGLINELFDTRASHQHTFDFLLGDYHKNGKTRTELPIDAFYKAKNLAIELLEENLPNSTFDDKTTISGVTRSEQREIYRQRKISVLKGNNINLLEIEYSSFERDKEGLLSRNKEKDIIVLKEKLALFIN